MKSMQSTLQWRLIGNGKDIGTDTISSLGADLWCSAATARFTKYLRADRQMMIHFSVLSRRVHSHLSRARSPDVRAERHPHHLAQTCRRPAVSLENALSRWFPSPASKLALALGMAALAAFILPA
jgi:hypothetical protein